MLKPNRGRLNSAGGQGRRARSLITSGLLETAAGEYSYPAFMPVAGGMAVSYTWKRQRIAFWRGTGADLAEI